MSDVALMRLAQSMNISMIAAMDKNHVIGKDNDMPWHLPDDFKYFKANTLNKPVVMGRKTFESIGSRPLPNRRNIVITRNADYDAPGAEVFTSVEAALNTCQNDDEIMIMGGGQFYHMMLPFANKLYVTLVNTEVDGDTTFPKWQESEWHETFCEHHPEDERHAFSFDFIVLERNTNK